KTQKNEVAKGLISQESPATITIKPAGGGKALVIPAPDITEVEYRYVDNEKFLKLDWGRPTNALARARKAAKPAERKKDLDLALESFRELVPKVADNKTWARHVQFGIAEALALKADDDPAEADAAIEALKKFRADHGDGWQLVKATKLLVRLLE